MRLAETKKAGRKMGSLIANKRGAIIGYGLAAGCWHGKIGNRLTPNNISYHWFGKFSCLSLVGSELGIEDKNEETVSWWLISEYSGIIAPNVVC